MFIGVISIFSYKFISKEYKEEINKKYEDEIKKNPECFRRVKTTYYSVINDVVIQELYFDKEFLDNN